MKPGLKRLIAGILLLALAVIVPTAMIVRTVMLIGSAPEERFEIPGSVEFEAQEAGRYYLWHQYETLYNGITYNDPTGLAEGLKIEVTNGKGDALEFIGSGTMTSSGSSGTKRSVGYVELNGPDTLKFTVAGECPPIIFSVSEFHLYDILRSIFLGLAMAGLCALLGVILFIWGLIRLCTAKGVPPALPEDA